MQNRNKHKILIKKSRQEERHTVGKMNATAITYRLHNLFKIKDNSLTGRNYERTQLRTK